MKTNYKQSSIFVCLSDSVPLFLLHIYSLHRQQSELFLNKGISYIGMGQYNNALKDLLKAEEYYSGNPKFIII